MGEGQRIKGQPNRAGSGERAALQRRKIHHQLWGRNQSQWSKCGECAEGDFSADHARCTVKERDRPGLS